MSTFTDFAERTRNTDRAAWLGVLCWYSTESLTIKHDKLVEHLKAVGLERHAPYKPGNADLFRRVTSGATRKKVPLDADRYQNFLIRDVSTAGGNIIRQIVCETVDASGKRLDYRPMVELSFDGSVGSLLTSQLADCVGPECQVAWAMADEIKQQYYAQQGCHDNGAVRSVIKRVLNANHATCVSKSLFFVGQSHVGDVEALERLVTLFHGASVHSLPLVDDAKQRNMLRNAFEAESIDEVDRTVNEISEILGRGEEISHRRFAEFQRRYAQLTAKTGEYSELLEEGMATTKIRLSILGREMTQLLGRVKA